MRLTGGHTVTFGVWLAVHPDGLQRAFAVWWEPAYAEFAVDGWLGNDVQSWGLLAKPVHAAVRDPGQTPYLQTSPDPLMARVLRDEWPHEEILGAIPAQAGA